MSDIRCRICGNIDFTECLIVSGCTICKRCCSQIHELYMTFIIEKNKKGELP